MNKSTKITLLLLRVALGWLYLYAGITKLLDPKWSAGGYIKTSQTFPALYHWLGSPGILPVVNFLNEWGLTALGVCLILGIFLRPAAFAGVLVMALYYLAALKFPIAGEHSYLVDEHVIYSLALLLLAFLGADRFWSLRQLIKR